MTTTGGGWAKAFRRYDRLVEEADVFNHVVYPSLLQSVGALSPVLDFGGGSGKFLSLLPDRSEAVLYDPNASAIAEASRLGRLDPPHRRGLSTPEDLRSDQFAHVVMCFVLMSVATERLERETLAAVRRVMRPGARLDIVITDPRHRAESFSCFETDFTRGRPYDPSAKDVAFTVHLHGRTPGDELEIPNFHRPLEVTLESIRAAGLTTAHITPLPDFSGDGWYNRTANPYLWITATRPPGRAGKPRISGD